MIPPFRRDFDAARDPRTAANALQLRSSDIRGTGTNDSAFAGFVGEYKEALNPAPANATVTITNASPAVVTDTGHGMSIGSIIEFTTTGTLPTGLNTLTPYYISSQNYATNSYSVSTSVSNALDGVSVNTSSAGSGTHTRLSQFTATSATNNDVTGLSLTAGDWDVSGIITFSLGATTTVTNLQAYLFTTSLTTTSIGPRGTLMNGGGAAIGSQTLRVGPARFLVASTTKIFLIQRSVFATSTNQVRGNIWARRAR